MLPSNLVNWQEGPCISKYDSTIDSGFHNHHNVSDGRISHPGKGVFLVIT
jgi:hypothetical protein